MWKPTPPKHRKFKQSNFIQIAQTASFIYQLGDSPALRKPSQPVPVADITSDDFKKKLAYLKRCLKRFRKITGMGVGITAVQVGIPECFSIIFAPTIQQEMLIIINPVVTKQAAKQNVWPEICMSASPCIASVPRPEWVEFEYYDTAGKKQFWNLKADTAVGKKLNRIVQHEIDHMNGIINIDRVAADTIIFETDPDFYDTAAFTDI